MIKHLLSELDNETFIPKTYTIYSIVNLDNNKRYIGRSKYPKQRIYSHLMAIKGHRHTNPLIYKDSDCRFGYEIIEKNIPFQERTEKERAYIRDFKTYDKRYGYNANDNYVLSIKKELIRHRRSKMPRVYLNERQKLCHRLADWVQGQKRLLKLTDTDLAKEHGISQSAMSRKLRTESFDYKDFVFFVQRFQPDNDTLRYIIGL